MGRVGWTLGGAFLGGLAWSFVGPARLATIGQIASAEELRPATIVFNLQVLVGFGLAPLLIGLVRSRAGWEAVLAVAAGGFAAASLLLVRLRTRAVAQGAQASVLADIRQGFTTVAADPLLTQLMLAAILGYAMTGPLQILLPKLAREVLQLTELQRGAYLGLLALSLIAGGIAALALARRLHHGRVVLAGIGAGGCCSPPWGCSRRRNSLPWRWRAWGWQAAWSSAWWWQASRPGHPWPCAGA